MSFDQLIVESNRLLEIAKRNRDRINADFADIEKRFLFVVCAKHCTAQEVTERN